MRCLALFALVAALAASEFPLPAVGYAATEDISAGWRFAWDGGDVGLDQRWELPTHDRSKWTAIDLPRVWDREPGAVAVPIRTGVGWFARRITVPADWDGRVLLHCLGVQFMCDAFVDGEYVDVHLGGYTPFALDLTDLVEPGGEHLLVLRVDNRLDKESVPSANLGWQPYGGITRELYLAHRAPVSIADLGWRCGVGEDGAVTLGLNGRLVATKATTGAVSVTLLADGQAVAAPVKTPVALAAAGEQPLAIDLTLRDARLWSPADPYLHRLRIDYPGGALEIPLGLREIRVDGERFLLNGEPLWLQGFGLHEEWAGYGPCVPRSQRRAELELMKREYAINSIRPGHYPNHPDLYRQCDELGILVFSEIPAWQIPKPWLASDAAWEDWLKPQVDEMIAAYGAFTSVAAWSGGNENSGDAAHAFHRRVLAYLGEVAPDRIPMIVMDRDKEHRLDEFTPLVARNYHYGWYHSKQVYAIRQQHAENLRHAAGKAMWIAEQGAHAIRGRFNGAYNDLSRGSEIYQDQCVRYGYQYASTRNDAIVGISPWSWADFHRGNRLEPHGLVTSDRQPKLLAATLRELMGGGPHRVFGTEFSTFCEPGGKLLVNVHSFRPEPGVVSGAFRVRWSVRSAAGELAAGELPFEADGARSQKVGMVTWEIPPDAAGHHGLWLQLEDADGGWVHTGSVHVGVGAPVSPAVLHVPPEAGEALLWDGLRLPIRAFPGLTIPLAAGSYRFELERGGERRPLTVELQAGQQVTVEP